MTEEQRKKNFHHLYVFLYLHIKQRFYATFSLSKWKQGSSSSIFLVLIPNSDLPAPITLQGEFIFSNWNIVKSQYPLFYIARLCWVKVQNVFTLLHFQPGLLLHAINSQGWDTSQEFHCPLRISILALFHSSSFAEIVFFMGLAG